jgi:hypothetical protein
MTDGGFDYSQLVDCKVLPGGLGSLGAVLLHYPSCKLVVKALAAYVGLKLFKGGARCHFSVCPIQAGAGALCKCIGGQLIDTVSFYFRV